MITQVFQRVRSAIAASSFLRFLVSGGLNTAITYLIYLLLLQSFGYRIAYSAAYAFGIVFAYLINRIFVFRTHAGLRSMLLFPLVYVAQYLSSMAVLWTWIERLHLPARLGPLVVVAITVPLTYLLSRFVFTRKKALLP
ncbi:GtrA family protein [Stenotrophomonas nitritireducens]|uniref:GtrA family protein n=1 Tax=Stenotrophomonas nitritireducens TaxID=83617 RepID=UPI000AF3DB24|nr:GtrA family protein [Stenotrophomonas nitritireducens]